MEIILLMRPCRPAFDIRIKKTERVMEYKQRSFKLMINDENGIAICAEREKKEDIPSTQSLAIKGTLILNILPEVLGLSTVL